jgi:acetyl esterase/lipase
MIELIPYGDHPEQFGELRLPEAHRAKPLVVLIHGGFWRDQYRLDLMHDLAADLYDKGYATWNIEYRRVGATGGGYPETLADVAAAIDRMCDVDGRRLAVIGHSAGGHLALWNASRVSARQRPDLTIGLAAVGDVVAANLCGIGVDATTNFFGSDYADAVEAYHDAQPDPHNFAGRVVLIHGDADTSVPLSQSHALADHVDRVEVLAGGDHFVVIDPTSDAWHIVLGELERLTASS